MLISNYLHLFLGNAISSDFILIEEVGYVQVKSIYISIIIVFLSIMI